MAQQSLGFDEVVAASGVDQLGKGLSRRVASQAARIQSRLPGNRFEHVVRLAAADVFIHAVARLKNEGVAGRVDTERGEIVRDRLAGPCVKWNAARADAIGMNAMAAFEAFPGDGDFIRHVPLGREELPDRYGKQL